MYIFYKLLHQREEGPCQILHPLHPFVGKAKPNQAIQLAQAINLTEAVLHALLGLALCNM